MKEDDLVKNKQEIVSDGEYKENPESIAEKPDGLIAEEVGIEIGKDVDQFEAGALAEIGLANDSIGLDESDVAMIKSELGVDKQIAIIISEAEGLKNTTQAEIKEIIGGADNPAEHSLENTNQGEQIKELRARLDYLKSKLEMSDVDFETSSHDYELLRDERAELATNEAEYIFDKNSEPQDADTIKQEIANIESLLNSDSVMNQIGQQIDQHYLIDQDLSPEQQELLKQTVEQTILRNYVFIVHTINEDDELRHNDNSNVSSKATFEDDLDILLSLEPSISASTVAPGADENGMVSGLWSHTGGVIVGSGQIKEAHYCDVGTVSHGIKSRKSHRRNYKVSTDEIDEYAVTRRSALKEKVSTGEKKVGLGGYNEYVIDNPKIFGYYLHAEQDSDGEFWPYNLGIKKQEKSDCEERKMFQNNISRYHSRANTIENKGIPVYIMTPDRKIYEYKGMNNGRINVGSELKPEDVANGKSGKSIEERKVIGRDLLKKEIFKDDKTKKEANEILFTPEEIKKQEQNREVVGEILKARFEKPGFVQEVLQGRPEQMQVILEKYGIKNATAQKILLDTKLLDELNSLWGVDNERDGYEEVLQKYLQE